MIYKEIYAYPYKYYNDGLSEFMLVYDESAKKYSFEMETLLMFDDEVAGPIQHMKDIFSDFTEWMKANGYDINESISFWEYFDPHGIRTEYKTVEKAYAALKTMIEGFINHK